jgi:hypothetical protein
LRDRRWLKSSTYLTVPDFDHKTIRPDLRMIYELGGGQERIGADVIFLCEQPHPLLSRARPHPRPQDPFEVVDVLRPSDAQRRSRKPGFGK